MSATLWQRNEDWVGSEIDDAFVMVNVETGKYVALNRTANIVWKAMEHPVDQPTIERALCESFEVAPEECHRAVDALLAKMRELRLAQAA